MGNEQSSEQPKTGYHVLQVQPGSPGENAGLHSFFDFIVAANGIHLDREDGRFVEILKSNIGKEVRLVIYNSKTEATREVNMIPSDSWGGAGLAGVSIRYCSFENANEFVWHVLDVYPNSPASTAGLQARTDYIVGTPDLQFSSGEDLYSLIGANEGKAIPLYVYSTLTDKIRLVTIIPNRNWGGTGSMGCDVGFGYLHRIPLNIGSVPVVQNLPPLAHNHPHHDHHHHHGHSHAHGHPHVHPGTVSPQQQVQQQQQFGGQPTGMVYMQQPQPVPQLIPQQQQQPQQFQPQQQQPFTGFGGYGTAAPGTIFNQPGQPFVPLTPAGLYPFNSTVPHDAMRPEPQFTTGYPYNPATASPTMTGVVATPSSPSVTSPANLIGIPSNATQSQQQQFSFSPSMVAAAPATTAIPPNTLNATTAAPVTLSPSLVPLPSSPAPVHAADTTSTTLASPSVAESAPQTGVIGTPELQDVKL